MFWRLQEWTSGAKHGMGGDGVFRKWGESNTIPTIVNAHGNLTPIFCPPLPTLFGRKSGHVEEIQI